MCIPDASYLSKVDLGDSIIVTQSEEWMNDLKNSWEIIFVSLGIALVFG
jgi:nitrogen fixation protein